MASVLTSSSSGTAGQTLTATTNQQIIQQVISTAQSGKQKVVSDSKGKEKEKREEKEKAKKRAPVKKTGAKSEPTNAWFCDTCGEAFSDDDSHVMECEVCGLHFCFDCLELNVDQYHWLSSRSDLHWYCKACETGALLSIKTDKEISARCADYFKVLEERLLGIEGVVGQKADISQVRDLETRLNAVLADLRNQWSNDLFKLEQALQSKFMDMDCETNKQSSLVSSPMWSEMASRSTAMDSKLAAIAADVQTLQKQTSDIQQDQSELEEQARRRSCVIVHGLPEATNVNPGERKQADLDSVENLMHQLKCDAISVNSCFRLGKRIDDPAAKPRPVKLILASELNQQQLLKSAKNLKHLSQWERVFIHPDLTPRQREARKLLIRQLKDRQEKGEQNLIIVGNVIVARRSQTETAVKIA
jgi:hypothetical protein